MLKSISLENYKCFKNSGEIEIAPLTVLCGVNSSGKSSILKSLLMLKQSYENGLDINSLSLNGIYTNNGRFSAVVHGRNQNKFSIDTNFEFRKSNYISAQEKQALNELEKIFCVKYSNISNIKYATINIHYDIKNQNRKNLSYGDNVINNITISIQINKMITTSLCFDFAGDQNYNITLINFPSDDNLQKKIELPSVYCYFDNFKIINMHYTEVIPSQNVDKVVSNIYSIFRIVSLQFKDIRYISPLRDTPRRRYVIEKDVNTVGIYGENTIQIVEKMQEKKGRINSLPSETGFKKGYMPINQKISDAINIWLDYIGIDRYSSVPYDDLIKLSIGKDNILDVGFGISQLFPILVNNITSPYKTTTLLEQPEVHLHPKMQMNVADMLIATSKAHKNVIVETHSDHIINRIVKRIMQDETGDLRDNVKIYFFSKEGEETKWEEIKVNMVTGIEHAPKGFFEQFGNETMEIVDIGLQNLEKGIQ